ncbi:hypothetical protein NPIL_194811 [Nephila pilipes]|uniref:Uncharacterized protein n=1 Tax=Nephila pilipes TaxID=299642 RepID=A0A8X6PLW6_NEPPI|nr:hypothetical protein NPIL_194811 [Nephila pilipes]
MAAEQHSGTSQSPSGCGKLCGSVYQVIVPVNLIEPEADSQSGRTSLFRYALGINMSEANPCLFPRAVTNNQQRKNIDPDHPKTQLFVFEALNFCV